MRLLLDTHALVWAVGEVSRLSPAAIAAIQEPNNQVFVSAISAWELAIKHASGKWPDVASLIQDYSQIVRRSGFEELGFASSHALLAGRFAGPHKDPFDRGIAAQSVLEQMNVVSIDTALDQFGVQRLW